MFRITNGTGFQMAFSNGYTVSVQFGFGSDSSNYMKGITRPDVESETAEVAVFLTNGAVWATRQFMETDNDDVRGHIPASEVAKLIYRVSLADNVEA